MTMERDLYMRRLAEAERRVEAYRPRDARTSNAWRRADNAFRASALKYFRVSDFIENSAGQTDISFNSTLGEVLVSLWDLYREADKQGRGIGVEEVFSPNFIEAGSHGLDVGNHQRIVRRKVATRVGQVVNPEWNPSETVHLNFGSSSELGFYTPNEVETFRNQAESLTSELQRNRLLAGMALSAGAGLRKAEMLRLKVGDLRVEHGVTLVEVSDLSKRADGRSIARTVPIAKNWAPLLKAHLEKKPPMEHILIPGKSASHRNALMSPATITQSATWTGEMPEYRRLRTTWIASLILEGLSDNWIIYLAGWERSHKRLVRFRNELDRVRNSQVDSLTPFMAKRVANLTLGVDHD